MNQEYPIYYTRIQPSRNICPVKSQAQHYEINRGSINTCYGAKIVRHEPITDALPETLEYYCFTSEYARDKSIQYAQENDRKETLS